MRPTIHTSCAEKKRFGFSIIELLVVISIIATILAILIPGMGKARAKSKRVACASNLRQIDVAMHMYINTNDGTYPCAQDPLPKKNPSDPNIWLWMGRGWRRFLAPYLGGNIDANNPSVLLCPADNIAPVKWESTSYSYSLAFYHSPEQIDTMTSDLSVPEPIQQRPENIARPAGKIVAGEWLSNHKRLESDIDKGWWDTQGQRNYLFADGQVCFIDANDIRIGNDGNPNPNLTLHGIKGVDWSP